MNNRLKTQNLYFPQWQGANDLRLHKGAKILFEQLTGSESFDIIGLSNGMAEQKNDINNYSAILEQFLTAKTVIEKERPDAINTLGGDCGVELAPVSYLNQKYQSELTVLWIDAHADLNLPHTSPSHNFHGMPLRTLLGEGDEQIVKNLPDTIAPEQVVFMATRDIDKDERDFIQEHNMTIVFADFANQSFRNCIQPLFDLKARNLYIHFDLDALEPVSFSNSLYHVPGGLSLEAALELIPLLKEQFNVVGSSMLEYVHHKPALLPEARNIMTRLFQI